MPVYETPGVYYERADSAAPAISAIRTDVTGFVGIAARGPIDTPVPVESFRQFQAHFGGFTGAGFLAYTVRAFFENRGRRCWVVRVASGDPNGGHHAAELIVSSSGPMPRPAWRIRASSSGTWGNHLAITLIETHRAQTVSIAALSNLQFSTVQSVAGFARGTLVRISDNAGHSDLRVVSDIDPGDNKLFWIPPNPENGLPYDRALEGFALDTPLLVESIEYTLVVREAGRPIFLDEGLSLIPEHPDYGPGKLAALPDPARFEAGRILPPPPKPVVIEELRPGYSMAERRELQKMFRQDWVAQLQGSLIIDSLSAPEINAPLAGGTEGLAVLTPYDFSGEPASPLDSDLARSLKLRGMRRLAAIDEIALIAIPDIHIQPYEPPRFDPTPLCIPDPCLPNPIIPPVAAPDDSGELPPVFGDEDIFEVQSALVAMCEETRDRVALLDPPFNASRDDASRISGILRWRSRFDSKYAALYYPWARVVDPLRADFGIVRDIPPSGHVAGQCAASDFGAGVHKAPANAPLIWAQDMTVNVNDIEHGLLNSKGIDVVKGVAGRGLRIMGARTVSSDPSWRLLNVRRLLIMIEKAIYKAIQWSVFEPNDTITRAKLRLCISSFLISLWQRGALTGASADEAFFVKCDDENNPPASRDNGNLLAEVGVAPSYPFEFVVMRVGRTGNELEIQETGLVRGSF